MREMRDFAESNRPYQSEIYLKRQNTRVARNQTLVSSVGQVSALVGKLGVLKSNVFGQCQSWLKSGLQPRSMTRDLDWGVDVPLEEAAGKKLYVWLDAPIGYISATKQWALDHGQDWEQYWKKQADPE